MSKFRPEKVRIIEYKFTKTQIDTPEEFKIDGIVSYKVQNEVTLGFQPNMKFAKVNFLTKIETVSENPIQARAEFGFTVIFIVENIEELSRYINDSQLIVDKELGDNLASIVYSTVRGVLLVKLQGTSLGGFILPVIDATKLVENNTFSKPKENK